MTNEELLKKLIADKKRLEKNKNKLNINYKLVRKVIDMAIVLEGLIPFIISGASSFCALKSVGATPFIIDKIECASSVKSNTSSKLVYSSKWEKEAGEYKRIETTYEINEALLKKNITSMTREEIEKYFIKVDEQIVTKTTLSKSDHIHDDASVTIITYKDESMIVNFICTDLFLVISYILGLEIKKIHRVVFQDYMKNSLINLKYQYMALDEEVVRNILSIKEENLSLLGYHENHR